MGVVFRQSIKTGIVTLAGALLGVIITWASARYIVDKQLLGFARNLTFQAVLCSLVLLIGLNNTLSVFIHKYGNSLVKQRLLITLTIMVPVIVTLIFCVPYFLLKPWVLQHYQQTDIPYMDRYYGWLPIYTVLFIFQIMLELYFGSQLKVAISAFMREIVLRVLNIISLLLYVFGLINFDVFIAALVLVYVVPILIYLYIGTKTTNLGFSLNLKAFSRNEYKEIATFSINHLFLSVAIIFMGNADVIFLPLYDKKGLDSVAIYSIAMVLISFLQIPSRSMIAPTVPVLARAIEANDYSKARQVFSRSSINILIATLCMAIIITCNLKNVVLLIKNGYDDVVPVFLILLIGRFADLATGLNDAVMSITKYYRFNVILSFILVPVLVLLFKFLVPLYGIFGAAWSTTVVYFVFNICKYAFVKIKLKMDPFSLDTIKTLLAGIPTLLAGYFLPALSYPIFDAIFRTGVICFVYLCLLFILKPSADLHIYLVSVKEKKKIF